MFEATIEPFSFLWWKMSIGVLFIGLFFIVGSFWVPKWLRGLITKYLGILFLVDIEFFEFVLYYKGEWDVTWALPLQYCTIMELGAAIVLITRWQWLYECVFFLGMIGPIQAFIAPALPYAEEFFIFDFYLSHAAPVFIPIYLTVVEKMRPRPHAWWKSVSGFALFALCIFCLNVSIGANYMFLIERPNVNHPLVNVGVWPYYLGFWMGIVLGWSCFLNLFFWLPTLWRRRVK